nr:Chain B, Aleurain peptide [Hordeum vulgare]
ADSNPIRPVT